jgi:hypothetical protein
MYLPRKETSVPVPHAGGLLLICAALLTGGPATAAVLALEDFSVDPGWMDRDPGEMTVTHNAGIGNPAGSLQGTFAAQGAPLPEVDAFRIDGGESGGVFTGDYYATYPGFTSWAFQFYADDVLPSALLIRFGDGTNTFQRALTSLVVGLDSWTTINVSLDYAGWAGGTASSFSNTLTSLSFVDIQVSRNGTGEQDYFVDNFSLNDALPVSGGSAVPEPGTLSLLVAGAVLAGLRRRHMRQRTAAASLAALLVLAGGYQPTPAGSYAMETFSSHLSAWSKGDIGGQLVYTNEAATLTFAAQDFIAIERGRFVADFTSSQGAFAGDYATRDLALLGFDFQSDTVLPAGDTIQAYLYSTGGVAFVKMIAVAETSTNQPQRVVLSLASAAAGGWIGGTEEQFQSCLGQVTSLQVRVTRNGLQAQRFTMDNVFVAGRPRVVGYEGQTGSGEQLSLQTADAIPGVGYEVVGATNLTSTTWETMTTLVSTSNWETIIFTPPANAATFFYRLNVKVD